MNARTWFSTLALIVVLAPTVSRASISDSSEQSSVTQDQRVQQVEQQIKTAMRQWDHLRETTYESMKLPPETMASLEKTREQNRVIFDGLAAQARAEQGAELQATLETIKTVEHNYDVFVETLLGSKNFAKIYKTAERFQRKNSHAANENQQPTALW